MKHPALAAASAVDYRTVLALVGGAIAIYYVLRSDVKASAKAAADTATAVAKKTGELVNPLTSKNIVYQAIDATGDAISMNDNWSLGSWLYDIKNGTDFSTNPTYSKKVTP